MNHYSPWSEPRDPQILFPINPYNKLLENLNCRDQTQWINLWLERGGVKLAYSAWPLGIKTDWIWGLGFTFLSDIERFLSQEHRILFGISGLPGCGKTSFGRWLKAASYQLDWPLEVISMDDFYLASKELDKAMAGNPWKVPRALPGSHSIQLLEETIEEWKTTGELRVPKFDKALRNGLGDRCGWVTSTPKILIIEGWFLGCRPTDIKKHSPNNILNNTDSISLAEADYLSIVQYELRKYQPIWEKFERVWHFKALEFNYVKQWKSEQETSLQKERGASIKGKSLELFIRMIETAIPKKDLESIKSDVLVILSQSREIAWLGIKEDEQSINS